MTNNNYRKIDGYEIHPADIAHRLVIMADFGNDTEAANTAEEHLTDALYHLDTVASNKYNNDYFRTFYNILAMITDKNI